MARGIKACVKLRGALPAALPLLALIMSSCGREIAETRPPVTPATTGAILGEVSYPSEYLPAQRIVAYDADTMHPVRSIDTGYGQSDYMLVLPPGSYCIISYSLDPGHEELAGAYSNCAAAGCVYGNDDHSLITVTVEAGDTLGGIDPADWYAPMGTYPERP